MSHYLLFWPIAVCCDNLNHYLHILVLSNRYFRQHDDASEIVFCWKDHKNIMFYVVIVVLKYVLCIHFGRDANQLHIISSIM